MTQELAIRDTGRAGGALVRFSDEDVETVRSMVAGGLSDSELRVFIARCERTGLDPLANQICAVKRWDPKQNREVMTIQVTIDGLRSKAESGGEYDGQDPPQWCGADGRWRDVWLSDEPPAAARVTIYRRGMTRPIIGITTFRGYCQRSREGKPMARWATDPAGMLAKTAEAQAFRRGFPAIITALAREHVEVQDVTPNEDVRQWQKLWFQTVKGSALDSDEARAAFLRELTDGATESLSEFLASAGDEDRAELIRRADEAIGKGQPRRLQGRNEREQAALDDYYASPQYAAQVEQRTPEQAAAGARKYREVFGGDEAGGDEATDGGGVIEGTSRGVEPEPPVDDYPFAPPAEAPAPAPASQPKAGKPPTREQVMKRYGQLCQVAVDLRLPFEDLHGDATDDQAAEAVAVLAEAINAANARRKSNGGQG